MQSCGLIKRLILELGEEARADLEKTNSMNSTEFNFIKKKKSANFADFLQNLHF